MIFFFSLVHLFTPFGHVFVSWINDTSAFVSLKDRDWSNQVMNNFKSPDTSYRVRTYDEFVKSRDLVNTGVTSQSCGMTPTMEKIPFNLPPKQSNGDAKKRHIVEEKSPLKRHKSENDETSPPGKSFDEPEWE